VGFQLRVLLAKRRVRPVAQRQGDRIRRLDVLRAFDGHRAAAAAGIRLAQPHPDELDADQVAVVITDEALGGGQPLEAGAFFAGIAAFRPAAGHLRLGAAVGAGDIQLIALGLLQAQGGADAVHGRVAAADHEHPSSDDRPAGLGQRFRL